MYFTTPAKVNFPVILQDYHLLQGFTFLNGKKSLTFIFCGSNICNSGRYDHIISIIGTVI